MKQPGILLHSWSLGRDILGGKVSCMDLPAVAGAAGFIGVEWFDRLMPPFDKWGSLARAQQEAGLTKAALSLCLEMGASDKRLAEQTIRAEAMLEKSARLGVKAVRVSVGGAGRLSIEHLLLMSETLYRPSARQARPLGKLSLAWYRLLLGLPERKRKNMPGRRNTDNLLRAARVLSPLVKKAGALGMAIGLENHFGPTSHPKDLLAICHLAGRGLGVCLDTGNFLAGQDAKAAAEMLAPLVVHMHFKAGTKGTPHGDCGPDVLKAVMSSGYKGDISIECVGPKSGIQSAAKGAQALRLMLGEIAG